PIRFIADRDDAIVVEHLNAGEANEGGIIGLKLKSAPIGQSPDALSRSINLNDSDAYCLPLVGAATARLRTASKRQRKYAQKQSHQSTPCCARCFSSRSERGGGMKSFELGSSNNSASFSVMTPPSCSAS